MSDYVEKKITTVDSVRVKWIAVCYTDSRGNFSAESV